MYEEFDARMEKCMHSLKEKDIVIAEFKSQLDACREFETSMQKLLKEKNDAILQLQIKLAECKTKMEHLTKEEGEIIDMPEIKTKILALRNHVQEGI